MASKATEIVMEMLGEFLYYGVGYDESGFPFLSKDDVINEALDRVEDSADEYYENDWFPLVATPAIRNTIDWDYITNEINEEAYRANINMLFGEEDGDKVMETRWW